MARAFPTEVDIVLDTWGFNSLHPSISADDERFSVADSLSLVNDFFMDELGFLWVRREPSPSEGDEGIPQEVFTPDGTERIEIGADYVLGTVVDDWGIYYVRMFGLDRGRL